MTQIDHELLKDLLWEAKSLSPEDRIKFLNERCGHDHELRGEVESLLNADTTGVEPLSTGSALKWLSDTEKSHLPERIGKYTIRRRIDKGGTGVVFEATQEHPARTVALKLLRSAVITPRAMRRFKFEADILGRLEHPNIARLYDADTAMIDGVPEPFLAMQFVRGVDVVSHANEKHLDNRARLSLLAEACDAVHFAHTKQVIHQDLKPSNILVDDRGQPMILDFGIARLTDDSDSENSQSKEDHVAGTLGYLSPEQASGQRDRVDTRSDVYSLGVIGFQLLSGQLPHPLPHPAAQFETSVLLRRTREVPAPRLGSLQRRFRGELEAIIAKALELEPDNRYQSASELAADIRRYLRGEPVTPLNGAMYHTRKFVQRNKVLVAGIASTVLALLAIVYLNGRLEKSESLKKVKTDTATLFGEVLSDIVGSADPNRAQGRDVKVISEGLDRYVRRLDSASGNLDALIEADQRLTLGVTFTNLAQFENAETQILKSLALFEKAYGKNDSHTADAIDALAWTISLADKQRCQESIELARRAIAIRERNEPRTAPALLRSRANLGMYEAYCNGKEAAGLDSVMLTAFALARKKGETPQQLGAYLDKLMLQIDSQLRHGEFDDAIQMVIDEVTPLIPTFREQVQLGLAGFAQMLQKDQPARGNVAEAIATAAVRIGTKQSTAMHKNTIWARTMLGQIQFLNGKRPEGLETFRAALEDGRQVVEKRDPEYALGLGRYAVLLERDGRYAESEPYFQEAADLSRKYRGRGSQHQISALVNLGFIEQKLNKFDESVKAYLEAIQSMVRWNDVKEHSSEIVLLARTSPDRCQLILASLKTAWDRLDATSRLQPAEKRQIATMLVELSALVRDPEEKRWRDVVAALP